MTDPSSQTVLLVSEIVMTALIVVGFVLLVRRRIPLAAYFAGLAVAGIGHVGIAAPRAVQREMLAAAPLLLALLPAYAILTWLLMRGFYWFPDRLSRSVGSGERGATERLKNLAELGRLGFRPAGVLCIPSGFERQVREYFIDASGTLLARVVRNWMGVRGLTFISEQDGARIETTDWPFLQVWPAPPGWTLFYHHYCRDAEELLARHRQHLAELAVEAPTPCDDAETRESERHELEMDELVRTEWMIRSSPGRLRMTLRGVLRSLPRAYFLDFRRKNYRLGR